MSYVDDDTSSPRSFLQLVVVIISIARNRPSLAIGNIIGSSISNILGAFSLGLIFYRNPDGRTTAFERSSTVYCIALLIVTSLVSAILTFGNGVKWRAAGVSFIGLFVVYIASISYLIAKGVTKAPEELSDSDSDSDDENERHDEETTLHDHHGGGDARQQSYGTINSQRSAPAPLPGRGGYNSLSRLVDDLPDRSVEADQATASDRIFAAHDDATVVHRRAQSSVPTRTTIADTKKPRSIVYHVSVLCAGFVGVVLSGYVLSNATSNLVDEFGISDILGGVVILSIATTIPEKFIAVLSGHKGQMDITLANTVGSNIFLLTLCIGIVWVTSNGSYGGGDLASAEIAVMFGSTVFLAFTVFCQGRFARYFGFLMLAGYIGFLVLEFTVIHKI